MISLTSPILSFYVDDTNVFFSGPNLAPLEQHANLSLCQLQICLNKNELDLHTIYYFPPEKQTFESSCPLQIYNANLLPTNSRHFLGVCFKSDVTWMDHVDQVRMKYLGLLV